MVPRRLLDGRSDEGRVQSRDLNTPFPIAFSLRAVWLSRGGMAITASASSCAGFAVIGLDVELLPGEESSISSRRSTGSIQAASSATSNHYSPGAPGTGCAKQLRRQGGRRVDLDRELRATLDERARLASPPVDAGRAIRMARRHQLGMVLTAPTLAPA